MRETVSRKLLRFPSELRGRLPEEPRRFAALRIRVKELVGTILNRLRIAAPVRNARIEDVLTGQKVEIRAGVLFTRISVDGRDYYFDRLTGRFDGTGSGCS
jgi:hypothetical protein